MLIRTKDLIFEVEKKKWFVVFSKNVTKEK